jgi:radical SAM protein with 4Fe4S-binding SPASM domain
MSSGDPLPDEVSTQDRLRALKWFAELCPGSLVTFTGGEALLDPDIFLLMETAKAAGLIVEIYTNGLTIKDLDVANRVVELADHVQVSMDGASAAVNDNIRGKGTFRGITRAITLLDKAAASQNLAKFQLRIAMTLTHSNSDDILDNMTVLIDSLELNRRPQIRIGVVGKLGRAASDKEMFSDQGDLRVMQAAIVNDLVSKGSLRFPVSAINRFSKSCGMGLTITVGANGAIYPCTITEQRPIGNIKDPSAKSVIASSIGYFKNTNVDAVVGCQDCSIRYFCGGMCRITNLHKKGSMNVSACTPDYKKLMIRDIISKYDAYGLTKKPTLELESGNV